MLSQCVFNVFNTIYKSIIRTDCEPSAILCVLHFCNIGWRVHIGIDCATGAVLGDKEINCALS